MFFLYFDIFLKRKTLKVKMLETFKIVRPLFSILQVIEGQLLKYSFIWFGGGLKILSGNHCWNWVFH